MAILMPDIIQQIRDAYAENHAKALKLLPELFQAADEGKIIEAPTQTVYELVGVWCRICRANHYRIKEKILGEDIFFSKAAAEARESTLKEREHEAELKGHEA